MLTQSTRVCWLCEKEVDLGTCKVDEYGEPVHGACYTIRLTLENRRRKVSPVTPMHCPECRVERLE